MYREREMRQEVEEAGKGPAMGSAIYVGISGEDF